MGVGNGKFTPNMTLFESLHSIDGQDWTITLLLMSYLYFTHLRRQVQVMCFELKLDHWWNNAGTFLPRQQGGAGLPLDLDVRAFAR